MILVYTSVWDATAPDVVRELKRAGADVAVVYGEHIPSQWDVVLHPLDLARSCIRHRDGRTIVAGEVQAMWRWKPGDFWLSDDLGEAERLVTQRAWTETIEAFFRVIEARALVVTPRLIAERASEKAYQLGLAGELGFSCPPTLVTSSPDEVRAFLSVHPAAIFKTFHQDLRVEGEGDEPLSFILTSRIGTEDLAALDEGLRGSPGIFQALVEKRADLRVTVVGDDIYAASIDSQSDPRTAIDVRRMFIDSIQLPILAYDLPAVEAARCRELVRRLGLRYAALDMVLTPKGEHIFLEANPAGMFGWIEDTTKQPISAALARVLLAPAG